MFVSLYAVVSSGPGDDPVIKNIWIDFLGLNIVYAIHFIREAFKNKNVHVPKIQHNT